MMRPGVRIDGSLTQYRVSREAPCPVCGKPDWCLSDHQSFALCQRIESSERRGSAGFVHRLRPSAPSAGKGSGLRIAVVPCQANKPKRATVSPWTPRPRWNSKRGVYDLGAAYYYNDLSGAPIYRKLRYENRTLRPHKICVFERFDPDRQAWIGGPGCMHGVPRVLYRQEQISYRRQIFVVEGEKCADLLWDFGVLAVTSDSGARSWRPEFAELLRGKDIVILPDNDVDGRCYARDVRDCTMPMARSVKIVTLPNLQTKGDIADWISGVQP